MSGTMRYMGPSRGPWQSLCESHPTPGAPTLPPALLTQAPSGQDPRSTIDYLGAVGVGRDSLRGDVATGLQVALFSIKVHALVLRSGLSDLVDANHNASSHPTTEAMRAFENAVDLLVDQAITDPSNP